MTDAPRPVADPQLTVVIPAYNEEEIIMYTVRRLARAFLRDEIPVELLVVDNGSKDRTGALVQQLAIEFPFVRCVRVEQNRGWGHGIRTGMAHARGEWVCTLPADSQVDAEDVVCLFEVVRSDGGVRVAKVVRRFRMDGMARRLVTFCYNMFVHVLWPALPSWDVNAVPKLLPRSLIPMFDLRSDGWAIDAEIMVKAHLLDIPIFEFNILSRARVSGQSHVRVETGFELAKSLIALRFSPELRQFVRERAGQPVPTRLSPRPDAGELVPVPVRATPPGGASVADRRPR